MGELILLHWGLKLYVHDKLTVTVSSNMKTTVIHVNKSKQAKQMELLKAES